MIAPPCVPRPASSPPPDEWRAFVCRPSGRLTSAKHTSATAAQGIYCKFQQFATIAVVSVLRFAADADLLWPMAALLFAIGQVFTVAPRSWLFHFVAPALPALWRLPAGDGIGSLHLRLQSFTLRCAPIPFVRLRFRSPMPGERRNGAGTYRNPSPLPPPAIISGRGRRSHALGLLPIVAIQPLLAASRSLCLPQFCNNDSGWNVATNDDCNTPAASTAPAHSAPVRITPTTINLPGKARRPGVLFSFSRLSYNGRDNWPDESRLGLYVR